MARLRLAEVALGLVAYGLDRHEATAILEGVTEEAVAEVYGGEHSPETPCMIDLKAD